MTTEDLGDLTRMRSAPLLFKRSRSLSDLPMNTISSSRDFIWMAGIYRDRLLAQRSALRKPDFSFDFPPPRGGLRSLSVGADCLATKSRAHSGILSQARRTPSSSAIPRSHRAAWPLSGRRRSPDSNAPCSEARRACVRRDNPCRSAPRRSGWRAHRPPSH
jgi:hypothetical protein